MDTVHLPTDQSGPTGKLSMWIDSVQLDDMPDRVLQRAKHLILDGIACILVGAQLPWSRKAVNALLTIETSGPSSVFGWNKKISPLSAALLNSTFCQGFELDDWHSEAPLHSNAILLPSLSAAVSSRPGAPTTGKNFLLAYIVGLEVGPRVGNALNGKYILSMGWHSGTIFGPAASASAVSKLFGLRPASIEDALGIACTQACGLMSAQFESEVKRMQHGFAARSGLLAAVLADGGYVGIKRVFEREFGGFLDMFSKGSEMEPRFLLDEVTKQLGEKWQTEIVTLKPYAAMASTHGGIDCIRKLQEEHPEEMKNLKSITSVELEMSEVAYSHGGWKAERPLTSLGAQMNSAYVAATQMIDHEVFPLQFTAAKLDRDEIWDIVDKTRCTSTGKDGGWNQSAEVTFGDGTKVKAQVRNQRGVDPELSNEEIVLKWRALAKGVIDDARRDEIEKLCLNLEGLDDVLKLSELLAGLTKNVLEL